MTSRRSCAAESRSFGSWSSCRLLTLVFVVASPPVGIDRVIEHAGVSKASLYALFGSKDELIRGYLERRHEARRRRIEQAIARSDAL
jgi:hypothetical protein